jgi:hypothetical protein
MTIRVVLAEESTSRSNERGVGNSQISDVDERR